MGFHFDPRTTEQEKRDFAKSYGMYLLIFYIILILSALVF